MVDKERLEKNINELVLDVEDAAVKTEKILIKEAVYLKQVEQSMLRGASEKLAEFGVNLVPPEENIHVVFSTDCSEYQDWQTIVVFHSATVVGQKGRITRIASGCSEEKAAELATLYHALYPHGLYTAHFTPDFKSDGKSKKKYDFYNKPYGMKHWLEQAQPPIPPNMIIALLDPDMILLRPITPMIKGNNNNLFNTKGEFKVTPDEIIELVSKGSPAAQTYGLGAPWTNDNHKKFNRGKICGEGSPCLLPKEGYAAQHYSVGPPYLAHKSDFVRITESWTKFVPRVYEGYPYLLAEMYAFSMAAAHEELPHLQVENYMISNTLSSGEGWPWVDALDAVCVVPTADGIFYPDHPLPNVVHFCQHFKHGEYHFEKRRVTNKHIFSCDSPLLQDVPSDLGKAEYDVLKTTPDMAWPDMNKAVQVKRHAFTVCVIFTAINAAITDYKAKMCKGNVNWEKTLNFDTI